MATSITISEPEIVALIEKAAKQLTDGDTTKAVAKAVRALLARKERKGSLFGAHRGSVRVRKGVDLVAPMFDDVIPVKNGTEHV